MSDQSKITFLSLSLVSIFIWSAIYPHDLFTWALEVAPVVIGVTILAVTYPRFQLTILAYLMIWMHAVVLMVGGHYTYAEVPLFNWIRDAFQLSRNHYDRVGHFAQRFFPAILAREILLRKSPLEKGKWLFFIVVSICLAISAFYELIEWWVALATGMAATAFLGTQGDVWDTQWDMALALLGAILSQWTLGRIHDRHLEKMTKRSTAMKRGFFFLSVLIFFWNISVPAIFAEEEKRSCFGLIWCTEERDGSVATDAFFYLYSSEDKGSFSRLAVRPFYSRETDPEKDYLRRSILWPLGTYERKGDDLWFHLFPLYWHGREPNQSFTLIPPLYLNYVKEERSYFHLLLYGDWESQTLDRRFFFPMYGSEEMKDRQERRFSLLGLPPIAALHPFPTLALYEHLAAPDRITDRFFPIYRYAHRLKDEQTDLDVLLLYRHRSTPLRTTDRLFPLYRYENDLEKQNLRLSLIGYKAFSLFWYDADPGSTENHLFPLYSYKGGSERKDGRFGLLGYGDLSLYRHRSAPSAVADRLFPLYDYQAEGEDRSLSLIGLSDFALYRQVTTPTEIRHRLFPVYGYRRDQAKGEMEWDFLLLYRHLSTPTDTSDHLFPLYDYQSSLGKKERQVGILGFSPLSVYYHRSTPSLTVDRLFPLYGYRSSPSEGGRFSMLGFPPTGSRFTWALYEHTTSPMITTDRFFPFYSYFRNRESGELRWDALLLYQHQQTPTYIKDAFLPLHHYENDLTRKTWRLSLLGVPPMTFFRHRESPEETRGYLFPLYSYGNNTGTDERKIGILGYDAFSLYRHRSDPDGVSDHLFPIYGYRSAGAENRLSLLGLPPIGEFPALALYEHRSEADRATDRFFPFYLYHRDDRADETRFSLLLLYNHHVAPGRVDDFFFPLYSFGKEAAKSEFSMIGYKELSLLRYASTSSTLHHRFFPVYLYNHDRVKGETSIHALLLYWQRSNPEAEKNGFFPLYSFQKDRPRDEWRLSLLGLDPFLPISLIHHTAGPEASRGAFFPLYDYRRQKEERTLSLLGVSSLAFYRHESTPTLTTDRFFPLYSYRYDLEKEERSLNALLLFRYASGPGRTEQRFFPLYSYESDEAKGEKRWGLFGLAPISLYQHLTTSEKTSDRFFPLYHYTSDQTNGEGEFSLLWPLFNYKSRNGKTTEASFLWWLVNYERPEEGHREFRILGGSAMAVLRRRATPEGSLFEFNPIIPFYSYEEETGKGSEWNLLGGLLGRRTRGEEKQTRAFWIYF